MPAFWVIRSFVIQSLKHQTKTNEVRDVITLGLVILERTPSPGLFLHEQELLRVVFLFLPGRGAFSYRKTGKHKLTAMLFIM